MNNVNKLTLEKLRDDPLLDCGATPATNYLDVLHALKLEEAAVAKQPTAANAVEQTILDLMSAGTRDGEELLAVSKLDVAEFNQTLTMLEITGKIRTLGAGQWVIN